MSELKTTDFKPFDTQPDINHVDAIRCPRCPVCGAETVLIQKHKAVAALTNVFRCTECGVQYPVEKKNGR